MKAINKLEIARFSMLFSIFTAPFFTIAASMQMSVKPHENLYGAPQRDTDSLKMLSEKLKMKQLTGTQNKSLIKSNSTSNVKIFESNRRRKLKKLSGSVGKNSPYRAPVYQNYAECIKGLSKQGFLGFYKGNMYRQFGILFTGIGQIQIAHK